MGRSGGSFSEDLSIDLTDLRTHVLMAKPVPAEFSTFLAKSGPHVRVGSESENGIDQFGCRFLSDKKPGLSIENDFSCSPDIE